MHATTRGVRRFGQLRQSIYVTLPPKKGEERKPRPKGWNAERAAARAAKREAKAVERKANRGLRSRRALAGSPMQGVPASINRRTGKPHEHSRERSRRMLAAAIKTLGLTRSSLPAEAA